MCEKGICSRPQKALTQVFISMQPSMLPMIMQGSYNCSVHNPNFLRSLHTQCASKAYGFTMEGLRASVHCALCTCVAQHVVNDCARAHIVLVHSTPLCKQPTQKKNIAYMHGARVACGSMPLQDPHWVNSQCFYAKPASTHKVLYVGSVYSKLVWGLSEGQFALARQGPGVRYLVQSLPNLNFYRFNTCTIKDKSINKILIKKVNKSCTKSIFTMISFDFI